MLGLGAFVALGVTNAWRNLGKSLLTVFGMVVASAVLTSSLSLGAGYPAGAYRGERAFLGGDVVIFPFRYRVDVQTDLPRSRIDRVPADFPSDLAAFFPETYRSGFLRPPGSSSYSVDLGAVTTAAADAATRIGLNRSAEVTVYPHYFLPAIEPEKWSPPYMGVPDPPPETLWQSVVALRSRDNTLDDRGGFDRYIVTGRPFEPSDAGRLVCVVDRRRSFTSSRVQPPAPRSPTGKAATQEPLPGADPVPPLASGETVSLLIPRPLQDPDGQVLAYDYSHLTPVALEVIGTYSLPTHILAYKPPGPGHAVAEQLYWTSTDIMVPTETLRAIFELAGGDSRGLEPGEVTIGLPRLDRVEDYSRALREIAPGSEVWSVPELVEAGRLRGLPEPLLKLPWTAYGHPSVRQQPGVPAQAGQLFVFLVYLIAGALLATNMSILLTSRRKEIGIVRALGARAHEVLATLLSESVTLSLLGSGLGFGLTRMAATHVLLSNKRPLAEILTLTSHGLAQVVGATLGFALVFGALAARDTVRSATMEVLRQE